VAKLALLGSTGSIGRQAVEVVRSQPGTFEVTALGARASVEELAAQARELRAPRVAVSDAACARKLSELVPSGTEVLAGPGSLAEASSGADVVLNAVVGFAGLPVTLRSLESGSRLALANKESLISAAPVVQSARGTPGAEIVPVDSEHCALHQCLRCAAGDEEVARLVLTASGGPFREWSEAELESATVEDALAHPTWSMGPKITVDSSTLMNKGLEVIEAHELFGIDYGKIEVIVHRQSVVHSMVEMTDGATIAQLSTPDMRLPIGYALGFPRRLSTAFGTIDWSRMLRLDFEPVDLGRFRCLSLAYEAGRRGGSAPCWLNAANEVAVASFLEGRIPWKAISAVVEATLEAHTLVSLESEEEVVEADQSARRAAARVVERMSQAA
jgi:1-deoxy-D-xylulose-5-phosphate reductoisomerase